jgi:hypothetical protein
MRSFPMRSVAGMALIVLSVALYGCSRLPESTTWTEQVSLSDGRTITVRRTVRYEDRTTVGGPAEVGIVGSEVVALEPRDAFPPWSAPLMLKLIDFDSARGQWVFIAEADDCRSWAAVGRHRTNTVVYRSMNGTWTVSALEPQWFGRSSNVLIKTLAARRLQDDQVVDAAFREQYDGRLLREVRVLKDDSAYVVTCLNWSG